MKKTKRIISFAVALIMSVMPLSGVTLAADSSTADNTFTFSDTGIDASGSGTGYAISGTVLTISGSGTYILTGTCADGTVEVKKETADVTLILDNLTLTSASTAPIICGASTQVTIRAVGTSTLRDTIGANADGSVIKSKSASSLTFEGNGILNLYGGEKNGVKGGAKTEVTVNDLTLNISAANNALASDGSVMINSGTLTLVSGNDAIKSEPEVGDEESAGTVTINGGNITVTSTGDGIQSTNLTYITGGTFNFTAGGGYKVDPGEDSMKCIKSDVLVQITGGAFNLNCADDAIHSNDAILITGGTYTIYTSDDAIHADYTLIIGTRGSSSGPDISIKYCNEGFEAAKIYLYSGKGSIYSTDDGINAANSDLGESGSDLFSLYVYGGSWYINAGGDGIDSNGDICLYGGVIESFGSANGSDAALDFDGNCYYYAGTLLAVGMSGMAQAPTYGVYVKFGSGSSNSPGNSNTGRPGQTGSQTISITGGSAIKIVDSAGNTIYEATGIKNANSVVFSDAALISGQTYSLYVNGSLAATATASGTALEVPDSGENDDNGGSAESGNDSGNDDSAVTYTSYIKGYDDNTFRPDNSLSRAETAQLIYNLLGGTGTLDSAASFTDVSAGSWYYEAVMYLANSGIVNGYGTGIFQPEATITRAEFTAIVVRYTGLAVSENAASDFHDVENSYWAAKYIQAAFEAGYIKGYTDGSFGPDDPITRAEAVTLLNRVLERDADAIDFSGSVNPFTDVDQSHWAYWQIMAAAVAYTIS